MKTMKKIMSLVLAVACMMSLSVSAFAAERTAALADGTYTITANLYVAKNDNPIKFWDAYLTNAAVPPRSPAQNNATLTVKDGIYTLDMDIANESFALINLGTAPAGVSNVQITKKAGTYGPYTERISHITMNLIPSDDNYIFTNCTERADVDILIISVHQDLHANLNLSVDFGSAVLQ